MIDIVLATYNGERFLVEQVKSIQACIDYHTLVSRLIIVDDGSTDNTLNLITQLAKQDQRIELHLNESGLHGPSHNFGYGLTKTSANYLMLCDQDDIWFPEKISVSIQHLKQAENRLPPNTPILVFSDKQIVDENLQLICDSYFSLKNISKDWHRTFKQLCQQNVVSGCTTLFNRALMEKALPIPEQAYMHDWWLALVAHRCGEIVFIDKALIQYRQHHHNTIGARERSVISLFLKFTHHLRQFKKSQQGIINQAIAFKQFEQKNKLSENETLAILSSLNSATLCKKMSYFCKGKVTRSHFFGKVALLVSLLDSKKTKVIKK
ncbi:glycosyltransferase family 2 protein [Psychromonas sp. KJ10-2]|uniref:glycosyltransferase family 2 protein n=1 Tax=Psychromonas sp. KJ10-2 TaxID=3391822 RepID=UPI0039B50D36